MDLKSLKRKELQALCKKHGIPANSTSSQMIESLSSILENHDKVKPKVCLKGSGGGSAEDLGVVGGNLKKKVSFVVEAEEDDEVEEITRSPVENSKKKSVANEVVGFKRRSTRSRGLAEAVLWSPVIEKTSKKSMRVGTEGVRRNGKPILSDVLSTRSLRNRVVVAGGDDELVTDQNLRRTQKRRSIAEKKVTSVIEDAVDSEFEEITRNPVASSKMESDVNNAVEIQRRSTRSHGLAEAVPWSPVIEKTMKKRLRDGPEGVRRNDQPISNEVPTTRSLRNRVVIVGGEEESANDLNSRRTQKRKFTDKKDENEMVASKLEADKFVGRKNLRKRSRDGDFVGDEAPNRTSSHNHAKSEENVNDLEEVDVGRSMKRRKRDADSLLSGEGVDENIERANRTKAMVLNSNAVESGNVNKAEGQKKVQSRVKTRASKRGVKTRASKRGGPTSLALDTQVVNLPARRSTRSSLLVGEADEEGRASKKGRSQKGGLLDSEVVAEPIRRSTGASSTLQEYGASLLVAKSISVGEVVEKSKSQKQAKGHGSKGGVSTPSLQDSETHSSSSLLENGSSLPVIEVVKEVKSQNQGKGRALKGQTIPLSDNDASPMTRSIRSSAKSLDDEAHLSEVGILSSDEEAIKNKKPGDQHMVHASKLGDPTVFLLENEAVTESEIRSTRGSRKLLDGDTSSPIVKGNTATGDHASKIDDHATSLSTKRSTHGSSKLLKVGSVPNIETFGSGNEVRTNKSGNKLKNFELVTSVPDDEPVTTPSRIFTQSSSKLLEARNFLEAVSKNKLGKKSRNSASKEGDPTAMVLGSPVVPESVRRSTRSYLKHISLEVETSSPVEGKKTRKDQRKDNFEGRGSEIRAQTKSLEEHGQSKELLRRSVRSTSKKNVLGGDKVEVLKSDGAISVSDPPVAGVSFDLSIDMGSGNAETEFTDAVDKNVHEIRQSPAKVEKGTSLVGSAKDLGDMCLGSPTNGNQSSVFELANKGSDELLLNVEGSSEIEENVSKLFPVEPSTIEVNSEPAAPSKISKDPSATFDTEISTMAHPKEPDSMVKVGVEHDNVITGCETIHVSSSQVPKSSKELSLRIDSHTSQGIDLEERLDAEIRGAGEDDLGYYEETDIAVPTLVCKSSEELTLTVVTKADPENDLEEPDSKVECDGPCEGIVTDNEAMNILGPLTSDTEVCSDSQTSQGADLEEPWLKPEICDANEDGLQDNEEKDIVVRTSVCKSSEELLQTSVTVGNPEIGLKEPDSRVESDHPSEDVIGDDEEKRIFIPLTSDTEVRAETLCDINVVGSDSKVVVHDASEGDMEQNDATTTVRSVTICKSTGILFPISLNEASPHSDLGQVDFPAMNKVASYSEGSLTEASDIRCKTLEDSMAVDGNPGDTSIPQTIFDNEMENCKANPDIMLKSHLEQGECDLVNNIEAVACDKHPQLYEDLEVVKET